MLKKKSQTVPKSFGTIFFLICLITFICAGCSDSSSDKPVGPPYEVLVEKDLMVPMKDSVNMLTDVYRPDADGKFPVILARTPYGKGDPAYFNPQFAEFFVTRGFVFVWQDVRGKHQSEGEWYPYVNEAEDGFDAIEWAASQEWANGNVGMFGFSYPGSTQWLPSPIATQSLKAIFPMTTSQNIYKRWINDSLFRFNDVFIWHWENVFREHRSVDPAAAEAAAWHLPLIDVDDFLGIDIHHYNDWIQNATPNPYWDTVNVDDEVPNMIAPALIMEGWYDYYLDYAIEDFLRMRSEGGSEAARQSKIVIGPWTHYLPKTTFPDRDFSANADMFMILEQDTVPFFNHLLGGEDNGVLDEDPIKIYIMGENVWRTEKEWPLARTEWTTYYLHSDGNANTANGDGVLSLVAPEKEQIDQFEYDPTDPVPTVGGTSIYGTLSETQGPRDQQEVESRDDVLVYTTAPLEADTEITGPITFVFYASSSAIDTDFVVKICDVDSEGKSINIKHAALRARYRESAKTASFLVPGEVYRFELKVGATSNLFKQGHRIRLQLTSSCFPEYSRNLNTGAPIGMTTQMEIAQQTIYHDSDHPSHLILPVIPRAN